MIVFYARTLILSAVESLHLFQNKTQYRGYFFSLAVLQHLDFYYRFLQFDVWFLSK